ncbi:MAG: YbhB/YbcL family Raf kinase inhibitor-like protein [Rhodospirillales bacterium]|nr:YbhB/YbcL family Raf kinase inhibitor-like protein [Rhodospirillales bacterium]
MPGWRAAALALLLAMPAAPGLASSFALSSPDLGPGGRLGVRQELNIHGCTGGDVSPALRWRGAPAGTRRLALVMFDRDAGGGRGWYHWSVLDLPASARGLPAGAGASGGHALPKGARNGPNSFGFAAYGGPCPPPGPVHHYVFTLYALPRAGVGAGARDPAALAGELGRAAIGTARLVGVFGR